jgi:Conjugal transfer protein
VYSFVLSDVSETSAAPDLKIFIEAKEGMLDGPVRFVSVDQLSSLTSQVATAQAEADNAKKHADEAIDKFRAQYPIKLKKYDVKLNKSPFYVTEMYHDDRFTFINLRAEETPVLYELKDGKPNLVTFEYANGVMAVAKILGDGYLAIGKQRLPFTRKD